MTLIVICRKKRENIEKYSFKHEKHNLVQVQPAFWELHRVVNRNGKTIQMQRSILNQFPLYLHLIV